MTDGNGTSRPVNLEEAMLHMIQAMNYMHAALKELQNLILVMDERLEKLESRKDD